MPDSLIRFVCRYSSRQQAWLVFMTFFSFPFLYLSLEIPKIIVNEVLSEDTGVRDFLGFELEPVPLLMFLSASFLVLVLIKGLLKMYLNTRKGIVGEAVVRRLRYMLVQRLLLFPPNKFDSLSEGEVIAAVVQETDPLGGFAADAFALPVFQTGTLLTILLFLFMQNWMIGLASIIAVPLQMYIIPYLQRKINRVREQRVKRVRKVSSRLGETVQAASEIRAQGTREYTLAEFSYRLGQLYYNRRELFKKKFFLKFVNNFLNEITPFLFYAVGGYLVLQGELTIGALVAALSAHKNFVDPWRELLNFYRMWQDNVVRYREVVKQFYHRGAEKLLAAKDSSANETAENDKTSDKSMRQQSLVMRDVRLLDARHEIIFSNLNFELKPEEWVAVISANTALRKAFAYCLSGLEKMDSGFVGLGDKALHELPEAALRQHLGIVDSTPHLFNATVAYNLAYGLNHQVPDIETDEQQRMRDDAIAAGNSGQRFDDNFDLSWANFSRFEADNWDELQGWLTEQFDIVGSTETMVEHSLKDVFDPNDFPEGLFDALLEGLLDARKALRAEIAEAGQAKLPLCHYKCDELNRFAPLSTNLMFGVLRGDDQDEERESSCSFGDKVTKLLRDNGVLAASLQLAEHSLRKLLEQLESEQLPADHRFMVAFELHDEEQVEHLQKLLRQLDSDENSAATDDAVCAELIVIFMRLVPDDWFDDDLPADYVDGLLTVREALRKYLTEQYADDYFPFIDDAYNPGLSVLDNVLFGCTDPASTDAQDEIDKRAQYWIAKKAAEDDLVRLFIINTQVGVGGNRLSEHMQHQLSLLRNLIKRPGVLIMRDALGSRSEAEKLELLKRLREARPELALVWICDELGDTELFDRCLQLEQDELMKYQPDHNSGES